MDYKTFRLADSPNRWNVVNELSKEVAWWVVVADDKRVIAIFGDSYAQLFTARPQYLCEMTCTYKYYCEGSMELLHITSVYTMIVEPIDVVFCPLMAINLETKTFRKSTYYTL